MLRRAGLVAGMALSILFVSDWGSQVLAASRSRTINVSCEVPATVQMLQSAMSSAWVNSSSQDPVTSQNAELSFQTTQEGVAINTNLGKELDLSKSTSTAGGQNITTYSITVL